MSLCNYTTFTDFTVFFIGYSVFPFMLCGISSHHFYIVTLFLLFFTKRAVILSSSFPRITALSLIFYIHISGSFGVSISTLAPPYFPVPILKLHFSP